MKIEKFAFLILLGTIIAAISCEEKKVEKKHRYKIYVIGFGNYRTDKFDRFQNRLEFIDEHGKEILVNGQYIIEQE